MKFLLGGFVGLLIFLVIISIANSGPSTPQPAGSAVAATSTGDTGSEPADPKREKGCNAALKSANRRVHVWKNWERDGNHVTMWVWTGFYLTSFENKQAMDALLRCAASEGRRQDQGLTLVMYRDARTDKPVAEWSKWTGFKMDD